MTKAKAKAPKGPFSNAPRDLSGPVAGAAPTRAGRAAIDRAEESSALEILERAAKNVQERKAQATTLKKRKRTPAHKTMHGVDNEGVHNSNSSARQADLRSEIDREADHPRTWQRATQLSAPSPRAGMVQKWVRYRVRSEAGGLTQDTDNLERYIEEGWRPRKRETVRRGHELTADPNDKFASCYVKRGLILMELPETMADQRNRAYKKKADRMTEGIDRNMFKIEHPAMPMLRPSRKTHVSTTARRGSLEERMSADE